MCESKISNRWVYICNKCDLVLTISDFSKKMMVDSGVDESKIKVLENCHDPHVWNTNVKPLSIGNLKRFNFLFMADYTPRKGGDVLIRNYIKTFKGIKDVTLTIKSYFDSFSTDSQIKIVERIKDIVYESGIKKEDIPSIYFYGHPINGSLIPRFMKSFDCLVSPHKAEGWGMCLSQMQCLGKPVIATNYSGNLDFMNGNISYLIKTNGLERICDEMLSINPNYKDQKWAVIDEKDLCDKMQYVYNSLNKKDIDIKRNECQKYMNRFSYQSISNKLYNILKEEGYHE